MMDLEIKEFKELEGYKATSYERWDPAQYDGDDTKDWSGLYIAEIESTAQGYLPDTVKSGFAFIHKVSLINKMKLIICLDDSFKTGDIDIDTLKKSLRANDIDVQGNHLLIPRLGELGYAFMCYNNMEGDKEIIIPNTLVENIKMSLYKKCKLTDYVVESCWIIE